MPKIRYCKNCGADLRRPDTRRLIPNEQKTRYETLIAASYCVDCIAALFPRVMIRDGVLQMRMFVCSSCGQSSELTSSSMLVCKSCKNKYNKRYRRKQGIGTINEWRRRLQRRKERTR